jgi:hypothetical protein
MGWVKGVGLNNFVLFPTMILFVQSLMPEIILDHEEFENFKFRLI